MRCDFTVNLTPQEFLDEIPAGLFHDREGTFFWDIPTRRVDCST
jgi:hypothetical protein